MFDLAGRVALVTGAGQSVGAGIARALAAQGAMVLVNDIVAERADEVVAEIEAAGGSASTLVFDVTKGDSVDAAVAGAPAIDIVVNNAGNAGAERMQPQQFVAMDPAAWEAAIQVNLYGVMHVSRATVPAMIERGWGRVITISSGAGSTGVAIGVAPYSAAKGGGQAFMRVLAAETARQGVTCNSVAIGLMDNTAGGNHTEHLAKGIPVGRLGRPDDIGPACAYLASEEASWVTGQTLHVNGGNLMH